MYPDAGAEHYETIRNCMKKGVGLYDELIFLPLKLDRPVIDDGMRTTDSDQRYRFNLILRGLYGEFDIFVQEYDFDFSREPEKVISDLGLNKLSI